MPNSKRRELRRAIERAQARANDIEEAASDRQRRWSNGDEAADWVAEQEQGAIHGLYAELRGDRRDVYAFISEGAPFHKPRAEMRADSERARKPKRPEWRVAPDQAGPVTVRKAS